MIKAPFKKRDSAFRMIFSLLRRIYRALPLSPGTRFKLGQLKRRLLRLPLQVGTQVSSQNIQTAFAHTSPRSHADYVFFGVIDWHFRHQRPQHLALSLAQAQCRVFYVSVNFVSSAQAGYGIEQLHPNLPIYQIFFHLPSPVNVYDGAPSPQTLQTLREGQAALWNDFGIEKAIHIVQHPFWYGLASFVPQAKLVYDCMDFHAGFSNTGNSHTAVEHQLLALADLTIVTSDYLVNFAQQAGAKQVSLIRNAAQFEHFYQAAQKPHRTTHPANSAQTAQPVIGYYGAIADWFDPSLIEAVSVRFPHAQIMLIGDDTAGMAKKLAHCRNVRFLGEKPYAELPSWLAQFDVCLIPFKVNELTLATNPVKAYEYLSAGKPVVSIDLPEMAQFGASVYTAQTADQFAKQVAVALAEGQNPTQAQALFEQRVAFAQTQTWASRAQSLLQAVENNLHEPTVSVVVISYNQWPLTERCLQSLVMHSERNSTDIVVVDNASQDDTPSQLQAWAALDPEHRRVVLNADNKGFGPAVNQGLALAQGEYLAVLNNDIVVSPGWARGLRRHLQTRPQLGMLCPITNNIGNEAQVALAGHSVSDVFESAQAYTLRKTGQFLPLHVCAFFCVMMHRRTYETVGPMDEQFVPGFFEDDDYCLRIKALGLELGCAEDVFVYHELSASFDKLKAAHRQEIFERNKALFEKKWGTWKPHAYRPESLH